MTQTICTGMYKSMMQYYLDAIRKDRRRDRPRGRETRKTARTSGGRREIPSWACSYMASHDSVSRSVEAELADYQRFEAISQQLPLCRVCHCVSHYTITF